VLTVDFSLSPKVIGLQRELKDSMQAWARRRGVWNPFLPDRPHRRVLILMGKTDPTAPPGRELGPYEYLQDA
jgi:hypothetical protein